MNIRVMLSRTAQNAVWAFSQKLCLSLQYFKARGHFPNLKNPRDLSEIILSEILSGKICDYAPFADKLEVRNYITQWGLGQYLPKLYGTWTNVSEIDFDALPSAFALKTNHGCGSHYICPDKSKLDVVEAKFRIENALKTRFGKIEKHYACIKPQCYAEEYIADVRGGNQPLDYKFMCCDGDVRCILICSERDTGTRLAVYDTQWRRLEYIRAFERSSHEFEKPVNFETMMDIANLIAKKFPHVRVDLYSLPDGKIYIGELTFTPQGGIMNYFTNSAVSALGHLN